MDVAPRPPETRPVSCVVPVVRDRGVRPASTRAPKARHMTSRRVVDDAAARDERRLDPDQGTAAAPSERFEPGVERLEDNVDIVADLGSAHGEDTPTGAVGELIVVDLEGHHRTLSRRRQLRSGRGAKHDGTVDDPIVDGENDWERADRDPDAADLTAGQQ